MDARMLYLHAITPVHTGTGQSVDVIDLPVAREETTGWPYIPASSVKGVFRDVCQPPKDENDAHKFWELAFGPETERASEGAGCLMFTDARIVCLPVRSLMGTFAWVTCPLVVTRLKRDCSHVGLPFPLDLNLTPARDRIAVTADSALKHNDRVILEDLDLTIDPNGASAVSSLADQLAAAVFPGDAQWTSILKKRLAVVNDDTFGYLCETATQVTARVRIDENKKTVAPGALWYEEAVPAETIFAGPVLCQPRNGASSTAMYDLLTKTTLIQVGGNASVGRGFVRVCMTGGAK